MNRLLSLLLTCSLLFTCCACGSPPADDNAAIPDNPATPIVSTSPEDSASPPSTLENDDSQPNGETEDPVPEEEETAVRTVDPYGKMVALTFDDGPHETYSDIILDILEENHSVATFFEVGQNARAYPDVLRRMAELGCEIASHSNEHNNLTTLSRDAVLTDLGYADEAITAATGYAPTLVRPPYGSVNDIVKGETGRAIITWTVDTEDWRLRDAEKLIAYFESLPDLDGEVVLLHSIHGSTAEAMKTVIPWLIEQGYQLVTVSELMAYYYGVLLEPNVFYNQTWFLRHERTEYPLELPTEPMQTTIPDYSIVPVVPNASKPSTSTPKPSETPETPADPPEDTTETPPVDTPPEDTTETPPADTPPEDTTETPPADTPPEDTTETPPVDAPPTDPSSESVPDDPENGSDDVPPSDGDSPL